VYRRIAEHAPDKPQFLGKAIKNHLRDTMNAFITGAEKWARHLMVEDIDKLPPYCTEIDYNGTNFIAYGRSGEITTFDGALEINGRPTIVDTRDTGWHYIKKGYFHKQGAARATLLDDLFGAGNYDRLLALPGDCAPRVQSSATPASTQYRGVQIVRMPFTKEEFDRCLGALAGEFELLASTGK
jgi:hypothetical protein